MGTLYVDRRDALLKKDAGRLVITEPDGKGQGIPFSHVERMVIASPAMLDTRVIGALVEQGAGLMLINRRWQGRGAWLLGSGLGDVKRRLGQYRRFGDDPWRNAWSLGLVRHKLRRQYRLLARALAARPDQRHALTTAMGRIQERLRALTPASQTPGRGTLRGIEGAAAAAYFPGLAAVFPDSLEFKGRNRRPPRDPVNACLSLGYTLLHGDAVSACHTAGLDPLLGFYHEPAYGRASLGTDLMEPFRPVLDEWVWGLFRERVLRPEQFQNRQGACLLDKAGRSRFYPAYEVFAGPVRRALRRYAMRLARTLEKEGEGMLEPQEEEDND